VPWVSIRRPSRSADGSEFGTDLFVAQQQGHHVVGTLDQRAEQAFEGRAVLEFGAGAVQVAVGDDRGAPRQRVGVRDRGHRQLDAAGGQVEFFEERRRQRQRVHGRADVVQDSRRIWVGCGPRTPAKGRLSFDDLHFQAGPGADCGSRQPVGSAADDGDVHASITADRLAG
jgi:hypothetical protein